MVMDVEPSEEDAKKANSLVWWMGGGWLGAMLGASLIIWLILYPSGTALSSDDLFGGNMIIGLWYIFNCALLLTAILTYLRVGYWLIFVLILIATVAGIGSGLIGTVFSVICLIKLFRCKNAFPAQLEKSVKRQEARKKINREKAATKLELECPGCDKGFAIKDTGKRPLPIKCPHCGVEGEI